MVLDRENWLIMPPDTVQVISFAGLVGDGAPLLVHGNSTHARMHHSDHSLKLVDTGTKKSGFAHWLKDRNPFLVKLLPPSKEGQSPTNLNGAIYGEFDGNFSDEFGGGKVSSTKNDLGHSNGTNPAKEEEDEDLLADFIDEDSQLPSRISKPKPGRNHSSYWNDEENTAQTGSSICLLR